MKLTFLPSRRLRALIALLLIFVLGSCAYIETKQGEWIFNPVQGDYRGYRGNAADFQEQWIPVGKNNEKLHAWWAPVANADAPVLLYLHGARWNLSGSAARIPRWNRMGFSVLAIDYRGFGKSVAVDGAAPSERRANEDAEAAWDYLVKLAPRSRHFVFGHSLGGSMAIQLAIKHPDAAGLILEASFTSVPDMIRETRWGFLPVGFLVTQRFDNIDRIGEVKIPVLVVHGTQDDIVPFSMGERLYAAIKAPKFFLRAAGGSHHNLSANFSDDYRKALADLFKVDEVKAVQTGTPAGKMSSPLSGIGAATK